MIYHYDLHIHSVLSPCADCLMTPNNILNMAMIKGLNVIAITDHNSTKQLKVCAEIAKSYDLLFIPGVEITVNEGFDILVYFKSLDDALKFDVILEKHLPCKTFDDSYYGSQEIMDVNDEVISYYPHLLIQPLRLTINALYESLKHIEYLIVIPHLERQPKNILTYFNELPYHAIESKREILTRKQLHNSDAHQIIDILESTQKNEIELPSLTIDAFFEYFKHD